MSQENVELVRRGYEAFNRGDIDGVVGLLAPDFEYVASGLVPGVGGVYRGADGLRGFAETFWAEFDDPRIEVHELIDAGDQVVASTTMRGYGKQSGVETGWGVCQVWTVRDGTAVWGQGFPNRDEALEAAGLREPAMSERNLDVVRRAYEFFNRWGLDRSLSGEEVDFFHPEVEFHTYPNSPEAGIYRGPAAVIEYNQRLFGQFESVRIELDELLPAGDRVVVTSRHHAVGRTGHTPIEAQVVEVWTIRDGLLAERHTFSTQADALEAVGLREKS